MGLLIKEVFIMNKIIALLSVLLLSTSVFAGTTNTPATADANKDQANQATDPNAEAPTTKEADAATDAAKKKPAASN